MQFAAVFNSSLAVDQPAPGALPSASQQQQQQAVHSSANSEEQQQGSSGNGSNSSNGGSGSSGSSGTSGGSGPSGRLLRDYLALPIEQYSLLDPKWISRWACCKWLAGQACRLHVAHMGWGIQSGLAPLTAVRCAPSALSVCPQFAALLRYMLQGGGRHVQVQPAVARPSECRAAAGDLLQVGIRLPPHRWVVRQHLPCLTQAVWTILLLRRLHIAGSQSLPMPRMAGPHPACSAQPS